MDTVSDPSIASSGAPRYSLRQLLRCMLRLGTLGFGGPVALAGHMHRDLVDERNRISDVDYKEGLALAQLMPGPLAAQLAMYLGYVVNVPSAHAVVVVDRGARRPMARWETPWATQNYAMALDEEGRRLFVGARSPPVLLVYDIGSGNVIARLPIGKDSDDVFFDAERKRVYVICGEGKVDAFRQETPDRYVLEEAIVTAPHARTGLFVPAESALYVAAPAAGPAPARVLVYRAR